MAATTTVSGLRTALATQLGTIRGLRVAPTVPDNPAPPVAIIVPQNIDYDTAMQRGLDTYTFNILLIVGRVSERTAQANLDGYLAPAGAGSVKAAINADPTLGGACQSARVVSVLNYGSLTVGDTEYLSASLSVTVYA